MEGLPAGYSQSDIMAALAAASQRPKPPTSSFADHSKHDLTVSGSFDGVPINARRLVCPRDGCGCVIVGPKVASWEECEGAILPHDATPFPPPGNTAYWRVDGGPYAFDNIGFSRNVDATLPAGAPGAGGKVKWLICAECDIGPIGWTTEGGQSSWVAADRLFRDAQTFESPPSWPFKYSVTLPDAEIETSAIFDLFLDLIVNIPLQGLLSPTKALTFPDWLCINNLIKFLHKWEVSQPYCKVLRHNINQELANSDTALQYFTIGAIANDADICRAVLQHHSDNKLAAFNPYRFQYFMWKACPAPYLGALTRAWSEAQSNQSYNFISRFNLHLTDNTFSEAQLRHRVSSSNRGFMGE
ncbi:hypothetical protein CcaverHIS002_0506000 [Cutaneotrichosporon cavernicola]|nr:hypothetical protein CcaverHIS002_0506000 [Cutaneotrichosporon cavernicola]